MQISQNLLNLIRGNPRITVLTGSGISAESGIPTFRDAQTGLWETFSPEELATPEAFEANPTLVWRWYAWRRELIAKARPNPAHLVLARIQARLPDLTLLTQNVDGLHQRAGSRDVVEYHGNILRTRCSRHGCLPDVPPGQGEPPLCPACYAPLRPDVVWFGETIPAYAQLKAVEASEDCDLFMAIGTSAMVYPAASLAELAKARGASFIEINTQVTPLSPLADFRLQGPAAEILPELERAAWPGVELL
jgi:NAD-dependent deacetylase